MFAARLAEEQSTNADTLRRYDDLLAASLGPVEKHLSGVTSRIRDARGTLDQARQAITGIHTDQAGELAKLTALYQAASEQPRQSFYFRNCGERGAANEETPPDDLHNAQCEYPCSG